MNEKKELFETVPVPKALMTLALPSIASQLITMIYSLADTLYIGMTDDPIKVAAISVVSVLFFVMNAFANLFGVGGGSQVSRLLGKGGEEEVRRVTAFSFWGALAVALLYSLLCLSFSKPLMRFIGATDNTLEYTLDYLFWVVILGGVPSTLSMVMSHLLRGAGYARQASFGIGLGGLLNLFLDPLFMFVILPEGLEVTGVALATFTSNVVSLLYFAAAFFRLRRRSALALTFSGALPSRESVQSIFSVGLPSAISTLLACVTTGIATRMTSAMGDIPVAAIWIVKKIDQLPLNIGMGLCQGMMPLVAYNYSSHNKKRMDAFIHVTKIAGVSFAVVCVLVFEVFADQVIQLFIQDAETVRLGISFLRIASLGTPFMVYIFQIIHCFQAMNKGKATLLLSICRQGAVYLPILFTMRHLFGLYGIVWAQIVSNMITMLIARTMYLRARSSL